MKSSLVAWFAVALVFGCAPAHVASERSPGGSDGQFAAETPLPTTYLMRGLVAIHFENLRSRLESDLAVIDPAQRESIAMSAALLREASSLLMRSPPPDDEAWVLATSRLLRGGSQGILDGIADSDLEAARSEFRSMRQACSACHRTCPADLVNDVRPGY